MIDPRIAIVLFAKSFLALMRNSARPRGISTTSDRSSRELAIQRRLLLSLRRCRRPKQTKQQSQCSTHLPQKACLPCSCSKKVFKQCSDYNIECIVMLTVSYSATCTLIHYTQSRKWFLCENDTICLIIHRFGYLQQTSGQGSGY